MKFKQTILSLKRVPIPEKGLHLLVKVKISRKFYYLVLDTGASESVLDNKLPISVFSKVINEDIQSFGIQSEEIETKIGVVKTIRFGDLVIKNEPFHIVDLTSINNIYENFAKIRVSGLLGSDFLQRFHTTISYSTGKITLRYP